MARRHWQWSLVVAVATVLLGALWLRGPEISPSEGGGARNGQGMLVELNERVRRLESFDSRSRLSASHVLGQRPREELVAPNASGRDDGAAPQPGDREERREVERQRKASRERFLDQLVREEPIDRAWARVAYDSVVDAAGQPELAGSSISSAECRTTICRVVVEHSGREAEGRFQDLFFGKAAETPRATTRRQVLEDGRVAWVSYLMRRGYQMPSLAEFE